MVNQAEQWFRKHFKQGGEYRLTDAEYADIYHDLTASISRGAHSCWAGGAAHFADGSKVFLFGDDEGEWVMLGDKLRYPFVSVNDPNTALVVNSELELEYA